MTSFASDCVEKAGTDELCVANRSCDILGDLRVSRPVTLWSSFNFGAVLFELSEKGGSSAGDDLICSI